MPGEGSNTEDKIQTPAQAVGPAEENQTADRTQSGQTEEAHEEISNLETEASRKSQAADSESDTKVPGQLNPFEQLDGLSNLMSQLMPGSDQATGFDMGEMKDTFSNANQTGSFASIAIKPGGQDGLLADTLPVPPDMQGIWEQMHAIRLPEVLSFLHELAKIILTGKSAFGCCFCTFRAARTCYRRIPNYDVVIPAKKPCEALLLPFRMSIFITLALTPCLLLSSLTITCEI